MRERYAPGQRLRGAADTFDVEAEAGRMEAVARRSPLPGLTQFLKIENFLATARDTRSGE
ncbi:MAG: hypothetical protein H0U81_07335 [Pyrinomonadaceae bacterium]|nr:hypothetical protein [Pyrinomonadaceae bacterium]